MLGGGGGEVCLCCTAQLAWTHQGIELETSYTICFVVIAQQKNVISLLVHVAGMGG